MPNPTHLFTVADAFQCPIYIDKPTHWSAHTPVVVLLPALGVARQKYHAVIDQLLNTGYAVVSADMPGYGDSLPRPSRQYDYGYADLVKEYIPALLAQAQALNPKRAPVLFGHSIGGHIATLYAHTTHQPFSLFCVASGNVHHQNWPTKSQSKLRRAAFLFKWMARAYGYFPGKKVGFGIVEAKRLIIDWTHIVRTGRFDHIAPQFARSAQQSREAVFVHIKGDDWAPLASVQTLCDRIPTAKTVSIALTADVRGNPHSGWVRCPAEIVALMHHHQQTN